MAATPWVITGGGSGIGRALSHQLALLGEYVHIIGRSTHTLEETQAAFPKQISFDAVDVANENEREKFATSLSSIKGLIHNAAIIEPMCAFEEIKLADWRRHQSVNVEAPLFLTQALLPKFQSSARILHISSGAAHYPFPSWMAYCTSKAALYMIYQCLNEELSKHNIHVGSVKPGVVDTNMQAEIRASSTMNTTQQTGFKRLKEENQLVQPKTVARFLSWLLLKVDAQSFKAKEWDIYETSHHSHWAQTNELIPKL